MRTSTNKYQKNVSKWNQNPWKFGPRTQQKTMLQNRAPKIKKNSKNDFKIGPKEWLYFGGDSSWSTFGGSSRFCDQKVGPQRCQSAPKARKIHREWHKRAPRVRKWAPKVDPKPNKNALQKRTLFRARPGGLREALTITSTDNVKRWFQQLISTDNVNRWPHKRTD